MYRSQIVWVFFVCCGLMVMVFHVTIVNQEMSDPTTGGQGDRSQWSLKMRLNTEPETASNRRRRRSAVTSDIPFTSDPFHRLFICNSGTPDFVVGGKEAVPHSQPWMAYIVSHFPTLGRLRCAGTVISDRWVISAGHCFQDVSKELANSVWITLGGHDISNVEKEQAVVYKISRKHIYINDKFDVKELEEDIALLLLPERINPSHLIRPACLPLKGEDPGLGDSVTASGWGLVSLIPRMVSSTLQTIQVNVQHCGSLSTKFICATKPWDLDKKQDTCLGDSGGPLMWKSKDNKNLIVGVLSFGSDMCNGDMDEIPTHYCKVAYYLKWIKKIVHEKTTPVVDRTGNKFKKPHPIDEDEDEEC